MDHRRLKQCIKVVDLELTRSRTDAKALAKELGVKKRTVFRDKKCLREAALGNHRRLRRCEELLKLEYAGFQGDVDQLAARLGVDRRTVFRELSLIEEAVGRSLKLVPRRKKRTKS
jgi:predicted DNA-binding transcriptional regulator YafY